MSKGDRTARETDERERVRVVRKKQRSEPDTEERERERSVRESGTRKTLE